MGTSIQKLIDAFLRLIEKDREFFNYFNLTEEEAAALAEQRAQTYLEEALRKLIMVGKPTVDFTDIEDGRFSFELVPSEMLLIPSLMYEQYLLRDISYLKTISVNYTATDLRVFDPSNARKTFMDMYQSVCQQNDLMIDRYRNTDRLTGEYIGIDYGSYSNEEG